MLLQGDCLELMKTLPDKSIDLFICDLPYGCLGPMKAGGGAVADRRGTGDVFGGCHWDIPINLELFWAQIRRLRKNDHTPCIMFCNTRFGYELMKSNEKEFRYDIVWNKIYSVGFLLANKQPLRSHELIYVFAKKGAFYKRIDIKGEFKEWKHFGKGVSGVYGLIRDNPIVCPIGTITSTADKRCVKSIVDISTCKKKGQHPTAKPVELYKWLIERYSNEGDTILDPTFGSGNSGLATEELGRNYIGMEKDETFFNKFVSLHK